MAAQTPAKPSPKAAPASSATKQKSIMSFFQKSSPGGPAASSPAPPKVSTPTSHLKETTKANFLPKARSTSKLATPVASSDAPGPPSSQENMDIDTTPKAKVTIESPTVTKRVAKEGPGNSPPRKVRGFEVPNWPS